MLKVKKRRKKEQGEKNCARERKYRGIIIKKKNIRKHILHKVDKRKGKVLKIDIEGSKIHLKSVIMNL